MQGTISPLPLVDFHNADQNVVISRRLTPSRVFRRHPVPKDDSVPSAAPIPFGKELSMLKALVVKSAVVLSAALISQAVSGGQMSTKIPPGWHEDGLPILRFQKDAVRDRGWILARSGVLVFDFKTRSTTAHVSLPEWTWAGEEFTCLPDLALGPKGEAVISSNVVPTLWRIDPVTLAVSRHELVLDADTDKDVGFTGLTYSAQQGAFFAVSHFGALWRIDPLFKRAQKIPLSAPIAKACGVAIRPTKGRFLRLCVGGPQGGWTINLAPDHRSGYVFQQPCARGPYGSEENAFGLDSHYGSCDERCAPANRQL
jgi:hypothetical protein